MYRSVFSVVILLLCAASRLPAQSTTRVGLVKRAFQPKATRNWRGQSDQALHCLVWYPAVDTAAEVPEYLGPPDAPLFTPGSASPNADWAPALARLPLVVISHGTGGSALQIGWLGNALARQGFIAVAVDHPGNWGGGTEPFTAEGFVLWWERATDLSEVIDGVLADPELGPHVDPSRIGAAGFSLGGYTVLELAGARTDISVFYDNCRKNSEAPGCGGTPEMRGMGSAEEMLAKVRKSSGESLARAADSFADPRVKAVFALAPGYAPTLTQDSLRSLRLPVDIVVGNADRINTDGDAAYVRSNIHGARETVLPGGVTHYTFLDDCAPAGKAKYPAYCTEAPGIDREAVHTQVARLAADFFNQTMRPEKLRLPKKPKHSEP